MQLLTTSFPTIPMHSPDVHMLTSQTSNSFRMKLCTLLRHTGQRGSGILSRCCIQEEHLYDNITINWLMHVYITIMRS